VDIVYRTRWLERGNGITVPGHLWIEISGPAPTLKEALVPFANAGLSMLPLLSLSANAAIAEPEIELAYDNTEGKTERDFFQVHLAAETSEVHMARHVNTKATTAIIHSLIQHPEGERLRRAATQYRLSLGHWRLGRETLGLAHLWMAIEALTKAKIRMEQGSLGLKNQEELAEALGIEVKNLDVHVRKEILLGGDDECYRKAKKASDGLEHGFLSYDKISQFAGDVRHRMATHTRVAILDMCGVDADTHAVLSKSPFAEPLGYWPVVKYLRGKLIGTGTDLASAKNSYPFVRWKSAIKETSTDEDGNFHMRMEESFTPDLAEGISFQAGSYEAWRVG